MSDKEHSHGKNLSRRGVLKGAASALGLAAAGTVLTGAAAGPAAAAEPGANDAIARPAVVAEPGTHGMPGVLMGLLGKPADLPKAKGPRIVVVGGGWGGLTISKYLKKENPAFDVVMIDSRPNFFSCPMSNLWLAGLIDLEFLTHSYIDAAKRLGYLFFNATVIDVDRQKRLAYTDQGYINYEYLVLAPGIDYDYRAIGIWDPDQISRMMQEYPAAFKPGSEHLTLKRKIDKFEKGLFVLSVPNGNYRCLPAPYERACMIASVFKRKKLKAKVILLDHNPDIKIKKAGFHAAFDELYKDYIEYLPSVDITGIDLSKKIIEGNLEDYPFDDASIYPRIRASRLIETLGLVSPYSPQKEAHIDQFTNQLVDDPHAYVIGDSRPMGWSKSGSTAQGEAKFIARVIAGRHQGKEIPWESPYTSCYSMVNADPMEAIYFGSEYLKPVAALTADMQERIVQAWIDFGTAFAWRDEKFKRSTDMGSAMIEWGKAHYREMFE